MYDSGYQYGQDGEWLGELLALPVDPRYHEPVSPSIRPVSIANIRTSADVSDSHCRSRSCNLTSSMRRSGQVGHCLLLSGQFKQHSCWLCTFTHIQCCVPLS